MDVLQSLQQGILRQFLDLGGVANESDYAGEERRSILAQELFLSLSLTTSDGCYE